MHPLVGYGVGVLLGAAVCGFFYGYAERYQKIAGAVALGTAVLGGALLIWLAVPAPAGLDKRALGLLGVGVAAKLGGYNLGIGLQAPGHGFSRARVESVIGLAIAGVLLTLSAPSLKP